MACDAMRSVEVLPEPATASTTNVSPFTPASMIASCSRVGLRSATGGPFSVGVHSYSFQDRCPDEVPVAVARGLDHEVAGTRFDGEPKLHGPSAQGVFEALVLALLAVGADDIHRAAFDLHGDHVAAAGALLRTLRRVLRELPFVLDEFEAERVSHRELLVSEGMFTEKYHFSLVVMLVISLPGRQTEVIDWIASPLESACSRQVSEVPSSMSKVISYKRPCPGGGAGSALTASPLTMSATDTLKMPLISSRSSRSHRPYSSFFGA